MLFLLFVLIWFVVEYDMHWLSKPMFHQIVAKYFVLITIVDWSMWFNVVIFQWHTRTSTALSVLRPPCSRMADTTCLTSGCRRLGIRPLRTPLTNLTVHTFFVISYITGCARIKLIPQPNFSIKFTIHKYTANNCLLAEYASLRSFDPLLDALLLLLENDTCCGMFNRICL